MPFSLTTPKLRLQWQFEFWLGLRMRRWADADTWHHQAASHAKCDLSAFSSERDRWKAHLKCSVLPPSVYAVPRKRVYFHEQRTWSLHDASQSLTAVWRNSVNNLCFTFFFIPGIQSGNQNIRPSVRPCFDKGKWMLSRRTERRTTATWYNSFNEPASLPQFSLYME